MFILAYMKFRKKKMKKEEMEEEEKNQHLSSLLGTRHYAKCCT